MPDTYTPLRIDPGQGITVLDQTLLPHEERYLSLTTVAEVGEAIRELRVRGAPLLGLTGACAIAIAATERGTDDATLDAAVREIDATRPTAADLGAALRRARDHALTMPAADRAEGLWRHAARVLDERLAEDRALAEHGSQLFEPGSAVLTHCNTGALATGATGTALGVIAAAHARGLVTRCYATETRPLLQGARLTAWELGKLGIAGTLLPDTAATSLLASGNVQAVITGADRIAANGDTANKIGTYGLALAAARHGVPFYIAAPETTVDRDCPDGAAIPIEFRDAAEVGGFGSVRWAPDGLDAYNPAFDVTPAELIAAIVTERGVLRPPYGRTLAAPG